jgi:hypothetical protein
MSNESLILMSDNAYEAWAGVKKHIDSLLKREYVYVRVYVEKNGVTVLSGNYYEVFVSEKSKSTIQQVIDFVSTSAVHQPISYVGCDSKYVYVLKKENS